MAYEIKDNSGSLFRDDKKEKETDRDFSGSGKIDGREYWFSAWVNETKDGKKYFSIKFKAKNDKPAKSTKTAREDLDDIIPF